MKDWDALFFSDFHLGSDACQSDRIMWCLKNNEAKTYYFLGDIFDFWVKKSFKSWDKSHCDIISEILKISKKKSSYYIPGNHDDSFKSLDEWNLGNLYFLNSHTIYVKGKKYLLVHGDQFDTLVSRNKTLSYICAWCYEKLIKINGFFNNFIFKKNINWSKYVKLYVKSAVIHFVNFKERAIQFSKSHSFDGIICGHTHSPMISEYYLNTGDFVENCSFIGLKDGKFYLVFVNKIKNKITQSQVVIK